MTQSVKCWPSKRENLGLDAQHLCKCLSSQFTGPFHSQLSLGTPTSDRSPGK
ncbi:rCG52225 [Rattus norvegicus]|uniref:RCG52225 n=1 Tax=Rattus norvegicus TaxID=10116 RepID=A6K6N3_RAT|nr:rCG52225 [Rattus norvegicus]